MNLGPRQQAWVEALESGEYEQCKGRLCTIDKKPTYCCLGVACEVALKLGLEVKVDVIDVYKSKQKEYDGSTSILPTSVQSFFGFSSETGRFGRSETALTQINDDGDSFKEIAALVRDNLELIFKECL